MNDVTNDLLEEIYDKSINEMMDRHRNEAMVKVFEGIDTLAAEALGMTLEELRTKSNDELIELTARAGITGYTIEVADKFPNTLVFTAKLTFVGNREP